MKKITSSFVLCLSLFLVLTTSTFAEENKIERENSNIQFPVMSDIHIGGYGPQELAFEQALKTYRLFAPDYDAIALVGDLTETGRVTDYIRFMEIVDKYTVPTAEKVLTMGNHEFFEGRFWPKPGDTEQLFIDRFIEKTRMPGLYYDKWIKGYHFIVLGGEQSRITDPANGDDAIITDTQYSWLQEKLKEGADANKPIFVFLHQPILGTVYGSDDWGSPQLGKLKEILSQYPQVILFTGHSHNLLNHPRSVYQDKFTMVNTGSLAYSWVDAGYALGYSQGILVNVFDDKVDIQARDFKRNEWLQTFTVKIPFEKTIDDAVPPYFKEAEDSVVVEEIQETQAKLTWDPALDDETLIDRYYIKINNEIIKTEYIEFWDPVKADSQISTVLSNLKSGTDYSVELVAVDAWKNESTSVEVSFQTESYEGWVDHNGTWYYYLSNVPMTGWLTDGGKKYYLANDGAMQTGWVDVENERYYFAKNGSMQSGWRYLEGLWYYLGQDGIMQTGWLKEGDQWYYLDKNGAMQKGWVIDGDKWYYLDDNGVMQTGWKYLSGKWYFLAEDGSMRTGWSYIKNEWYFFDGSGAMQSGWLAVGHQWYYLADDGTMQTGWKYLSGSWYYLAKDGSMQTGWLQDQGLWYYLDSNGAMKTGWLKEGTAWYYLNTSGIMQTGWIIDQNKWYYLDHNGVWQL